MKRAVAIIIGLALMAGISSLSAESVALSVEHQFTSILSPDSATLHSLMREISPVINNNPDLENLLRGNLSSITIHDATVWSAARSVGFDQKALMAGFPTLCKYAGILFSSPDLFGEPRVIYLMPGGLPSAPSMVFGYLKNPMRVDTTPLGKWGDGEDKWELERPYSLEMTRKGPYIICTRNGRKYPREVAYRDVLGWIRIEAKHLVPERFEIYEIPIGETRGPQHLKKTVLAPAPEPSDQSRTYNPSPLQSHSFAESPPSIPGATQVPDANKPSPSVPSGQASNAETKPERKADHGRTWIISAIMLFLLAVAGLLMKKRSKV